MAYDEKEMKEMQKSYYFELVMEEKTLSPFILHSILIDDPTTSKMQACTLP